MFLVGKKTAVYTHKGGREQNEDFYYLVKKKGCRLFIVADGLGGHDCGEVASKEASLCIVDLFKKKPKKFDIESAIALANERVLSLQKVERRMKTTIALVYISKKKTILAHVGDTRIYLFKKDDITYQTVDHSVSQMAVKTGEIIAEQIRSHIDRNKLTKALGNNQTIKPDINCIDNKDYDSILMCTDGFWEYVFEEEMLQLKNSTRSAKKWLFKMREMLNKRIDNTNDNNTAITFYKRRKKR